MAAPPFQPSDPPPLVNIVPGTRADVLSDNFVVSNAFVQNDRALINMIPYARHQTFRRYGFSTRPLARGQLSLPGFVEIGIVSAALMILIDLPFIHLAQSRCGVSACNMGGRQAARAASFL